MNNSRIKLEVGATKLPVGHSLTLGSHSAKEPPTFSSLGPSSLISRLQTFLPSLKQANAEILTRISSHGDDSVNIEKVDEGTPHIEMNIALAEVTSESSSDESDSGDLKTKNRKRAAPQIELLGSSASSFEESGRDESSEVVSGGAKVDGFHASEESSGLPSGKWLTGSDLDAQREQIVSLLKGVES